MPLGHNRHQLSLEDILDFSQPLTLASHESHNARTTFDRLIERYHPEQTLQRGYKPVALVQTTFDHVSSKDAYLMLFFSFLYEKLCKESGNNSDITLYVRYFDDFVSWGSDKLRDLKAAIEGFAEYIIENFLLPRTTSLLYKFTLPLLKY